MERDTFRIPTAHRERVEELVEEGWYGNRSEVYRAAVTLLLDRHGVTPANPEVKLPDPADGIRDGPAIPDGGATVECPNCGRESSQVYRCEHCGADLAGKSNKPDRRVD